MKKVSKWLIALLMILTMPTVNITEVSAIEGEIFEKNGYTYTILTEEGSSGTVEIIEHDDTLLTSDLVIDSTVTYNGITYTVESIGEYAFFGGQLTSVTIPDSVIAIGEYAFYANQLTSVKIPDSVTTIGESAFLGNLLTSVKIPDSVITIGDFAFYANQLTSVKIPDSVTTIGEYAFFGNQLTSVTIGNGLTTIEANAFTGNQLTSVTIPDSVITIGDSAFYNNQLTSVTIGDGLTTIGWYAFGSNQITSLTIGNSVTTIGGWAFEYNQLTSVIIPDSVTLIDEAAFFGNQLTSLTLGNGVTTIGREAFGMNQLTSVILPNSVTTIGMRAFEYNQLTSVTIPDGIKTIEYGAFASNKLTSVTIPESVTIIEAEAFTDNQITAVTIPDSVTTIGRGAFAGNQITSVTIPDSVKTIELGAFDSNQLTSVTIGNGVTTIEGMAFRSNQLTTVTIPDNVTTIGHSVFADNDITDIIIGSGVTSIEKYAFSGNELATLYLANDSQLSLLSNDNLSASPSAFLGYLPIGIVEIYSPRQEVASYQDANDITKNIGETFEIEVNSALVYQQIERFNGETKSFIGVDPNASTRELPIPTVTYQWYKDDELIEGATSSIYSEEAQAIGTYQYHVIVNALVLDEIMVTINDIIEPTVTLTGTKVLDGKTLEDNMFSFVVKDGVGNVVATATNKADGSITFSDITYTTAGTYEYTVSEVDGGAGGITYDATKYKVIVEVVDNGYRSLTATASYPDGAIEFNNIYETDSTTIALTGTKILEGKTLEDNMFSFVVTNSIGNIVATATNKADGSITFSDIIYTTAGTYDYTVSEVDGGAGGISYDTAEYKVIVTVIDNGQGRLSATASYPDGAIEFNNIYETDSTTITLTGTKILEGKTLEDNMFSFVVKDGDGKVVATATNKADGRIEFGAIGFSEAGSYEYIISEVDSGAGGISYDTAEYKVIVTVVDNRQGRLSATASYPDGAIAFANSYQTDSTTIKLTGTKVLKGKTLEDNMFSFVVKDDDGEVVATATNKADGSIEFGMIGFSEVGSYTYKVSEVIGTASTITYDMMEYKVIVTVVDNGQGILSATASYPKGTIEFNNSYQENSKDNQNNDSINNNVNTTPKTGDIVSLEYIVASMMLSGGLLIILAIMRRRNRENN